MGIKISIQIYFFLNLEQLELKNKARVFLAPVARTINVNL